MLQKLGVWGRDSTRGLKKFPEQGECAGVPESRPASTHAHPAAAPLQPEEISEPPCRAARYLERRDPGRRGSRDALYPSQLTPYFLPLVETASLSLFPAIEFMVAFPEESV